MESEKETIADIAAENRVLKMSAKDLWNAITSAGLACEALRGSEVAGAVYALQVLAHKVESFMNTYKYKTVNCDVGTAKEQAERHEKFCNRYFYRGPCKKCCPAGESPDCRFAWAQMPYEAEEGGAK